MLLSGREKKESKLCRKLARLGQFVNTSVERFASVGETIGNDNPEVKHDMYDACRDVKTAGKLCCPINIKLIIIIQPVQQLKSSLFVGCILEQICDISADSSTICQIRCYSDRNSLVRAVRSLLSSVTRVLLIADNVVVKQLFSKDSRVSYERRRKKVITIN